MATIETKHLFSSDWSHGQSRAREARHHGRSIKTDALATLLTASTRGCLIRGLCRWRHPSSRDEDEGIISRLRIES
jgi:hypothetical protein